MIKGFIMWVLEVCIRGMQYMWDKDNTVFVYDDIRPTWCMVCRDRIVEGVQ